MPKKTKAIKVTDSNKSWNKRRGNTEYAVASREVNKTFLIVCEGQSEELYFGKFQVLTAKLKLIPLGSSKTTLVECAKEIAKGGDYDEVWCVFDMDIKPDENGQFEDYNNAIKLAKQEGFKVAYSNDAFELWYVLHYQFVDQEQLRTFYFEKLSEHWNINYEKEGKKRAFASSIYERLLRDVNASQNQAILNAEKLFKAQAGKEYHLQNPVTLVYELVKTLNAHLRK